MTTQEPPELFPASYMPQVVPNTTPQFWNALRHKGGGPRYVKIGRKVYYRLADVRAWLDSNVYERTDKPVGAK